MSSSSHHLVMWLCTFFRATPRRVSLKSLLSVVVSASNLYTKPVFWPKPHIFGIIPLGGSVWKTSTWAIRLVPGSSYSSPWILSHTLLMSWTGFWEKQVKWNKPKAVCMPPILFFIYFLLDWDIEPEHQNISPLTSTTPSQPHDLF